MGPRRMSRFLLAAFLLVLLLLCAAAAMTLRAIGPSPACRNATTAPAQPGTSARTLVSGGQERCYLLYIPPGLDPAQPTAVVFSLHGFASNAENQDKLLRWHRLADSEGFVAVYPEGTAFPRRWNAANAFHAETVDDVLFFRDTIADLVNIVSIDPARIYVAGMSNGGAMANRIACEAADTVAAIGTVAAVPLEVPGGCTPSRPVPVIAFHGTADPLVHYDGGTYQQIPVLSKVLNVTTEFLDYPPVETWTAGWAERNGCHLAPDILPARGDGSGIRYTGCRDGAEVVLHTIIGGGHTWPGSVPLPLVGKTSKDIDASATMWAFFQAHPRNR